MPPKPEYWKLSNQQFKEIKHKLDKVGQILFSELKPLGFTKFDTTPDWLGFTINKEEGNQLMLVGFSLTKESPITFELIAQKWKITKPSQTYTNLYIKSFDSIEEVIDNPNVELTALKERLENVL